LHFFFFPSYRFSCICSFDQKKYQVTCLDMTRQSRHGPKMYIQKKHYDLENTGKIIKKIKNAQ
jgi:hypothetical protein